MNYREWWNTFLLRTNAWLSLDQKQVKPRSLLCNPPLTEGLLSRVLPKLGPTPSKELLAFYGDAANGCNFKYSIRLPRSFRFITHQNKEPRCSLSAGLSVQPVELLSTMRRRISNQIEAQRRSTSSEPIHHLAEQFAAFSWPFCVTGSYDLLALIEEAPTIYAGVYLLTMRAITQSNFATKYAHSLTDWFTFLEEHSYVGTDWNDVSVWHDGAILRSDARYGTQVAQTIASEA